MIDGAVIQKILKATSCYFKSGLGGYRHVAIEATRSSFFLHIDTPLFHISLKAGSNKGVLHRGYYYVFSTATGHSGVNNNRSNLAKLKKIGKDSTVFFSDGSITFDGEIIIPVVFKKGYSPVSGSWTGIKGSGDISKLTRFNRMYEDNIKNPSFQRVIAIDPAGWAAGAHPSDMLKIDEYASSKRIYIAMGALQFLPLLGGCLGIGARENTTLCSFDNGLITTTFAEEFPDPNGVMPSIKNIDLLDWIKVAEFSLSRRTLSRVCNMGDIFRIWNDDELLYIGGESDKIDLGKYSGVDIDESFDANIWSRFLKMCAKNSHHMTLHMKISRDIPGVGMSQQTAFFSHRGISWICMPIKK